MLAEFLAALREGLQREVRPQLLKEISNANFASYAMPDGTVRLESIRAPPRNYRLASFTDLCALVLHHAEDALVFHDYGHIQVVLDKFDRREVATMGLESSCAFSFLRGLCANDGVSFTVPQVVRFLRSIKATPERIAEFRKIDFARTVGTRNDVQHGRESLGRSIEAAVQQADKIPEAFTVEVPVYSSAGLPSETIVDVEVQVFLDYEGSKVQLKTDPDDISLVIDRAHARIRALLPKDVECYRGRLA